MLEKANIRLNRNFHKECQKFKLLPIESSLVVANIHQEIDRKYVYLFFLELGGENVCCLASKYLI